MKHLLLLALVSAQALGSSKPFQRQSNIAPAAQKALQQALATHLHKFRKVATEDQEARKIVYGDMNGDGVLDAVVQYRLDNDKGNGWSQSLAVFLYKSGVYKLVADEVVGGKYFRDCEVVKISGHEVVCQTRTCPDGSPQVCDNPVKKQVKLVLTGAKLREMSLPSKRSFSSADGEYTKLGELANTAKLGWAGRSI